MLPQLEILDNLRIEETDVARAGIESEAGNGLLGDMRTAENLAVLEHQHSLPGSRQIVGGNQLADSGSDDDHIVRLAHGSGYQSLRISTAARRPDAPMMPPPGWVPAPHW